MMFKHICGTLLTVIFVNANLFAQDKYFIAFTDKNNSPYSIENPSEFLSTRSINRRIKQSISITTDDLPVNPSYIQQIAQLGVSIDFSLKWFNGLAITITNINQLYSIQNLPFVSSTKKIFDSTIKGTELSVDIKESELDKSSSSLSNELNYGNSSSQIKMINGHILHNNGYLGDGIEIAVLDAGFLNVDNHSAFDSLRLKNRILGTKDFVNPNSNIYQEHYHGTMVLSTMVAYIDGQLIGTAPHAKYWLIRTENANIEQLYEEYCWAAGAEFADSAGVDIINTSLGYTTFDVTSQNHTYSDLNGSATPITLAANYASDKGMIVVASAGNDGASPWYYISAPADSPKVLTVGAVDINRAKAAFSSFGPTYDGRIKPDVCAMGQSATVANATEGIGTANGTSFSSPIMAGTIACLWEAKPNLSATEIIQLVKESSSQFQSTNNSIGYGIPDFALATKSTVNNQRISNIKVYPNPFNHSINIVLPNTNDTDIDYTIYSIEGKEIVTNKITVSGNSFEIVFPKQLSMGNYIIRVATNSRIYFCKAVKL
ncbi:MAG: S8 family serine peptidase [Bacteroidales bacterium]